MLFGYVILKDTLLTNMKSVTLTPISIIESSVNELSFLGVAFVMLGAIVSTTVKLDIERITLPLVSFAKNVTLYVPKLRGIR